MGSGSDVDAVSQNADRLADDEEADAQTIVARGIKAGEGLEYSSHLALGNADPCVIHVNTGASVGLTTPQENAATRLCVFDGVADQIAQNGAEKQRVALDRGAGRDRTDPYALG
jgi:hypothetical protein